MTNIPETVKIGRLAMRHEGNLWNAYYAQIDTMEGAVLLGSIQMQFVQDRARKDIFMNLMREAVSDLIEEQTGMRPVWPNEEQPTLDGEQPAPEHERGGHA